MAYLSRRVGCVDVHFCLHHHLQRGQVTGLSEFNKLGLRGTANAQTHRDDVRKLIAKAEWSLTADDMATTLLSTLKEPAISVSFDCREVIVLCCSSTTRRRVKRCVGMC